MLQGLPAAPARGHYGSVVDVLEQGSERRVRRRWPWLLGAFLIVAALCAGPVWSAWDQHQQREIARAWALRGAYNDARAAALKAMAEHAVAGDDRAYAAAVIALDQEEAGHLRALWRGLPGLLLRGDTGTMRDAVAAAIRAEREELLHPPPVNVGEQPLPMLDPMTLHLADQADKLVKSIQVEVPKQRAHAANSAMAHFSHYLDKPPRVRLLVGSSGGMHVLDLSQSRDLGPPLWARNGDQFAGVLSQPGLLVVQDAHSARIVDTDGRSHPIGPGTHATWGTTDGTVWVSDLHHAALFDQTGRRIRGPLQLPAGTVGLFGAWGEDLLLIHQTGDRFDISVWNTRTHTTVRTLRNACPLAAQGAWLVWRTCNDYVESVHLSDLDHGTDQTITLPHTWTAADATFSPDGRRLALWLSSYYGEGSRLTILDTDTGRMKPVDLPPNTGGIGTIVWLPDSASAFVGYIRAEQQRVAYLDTVTAHATPVRFYTPGLVPLAVLPLSH